VAKRARRKNEALLGWVRAAAIAAFTWYALAGAEVRPLWLAPLLGVLAGALMLASADLGVLAAILALSIPVIAVQPLAGIALLVMGVVAIRYLAADGAAVFLVIAAAVVGANVGPVWLAVALAGYFLGATEGALTAAVACLTVEIIGVALGKPALGITLTGGSQALVSFAHAPESLLAGGWIADSFSGLGVESVNRLISTVSRVSQPVALLAQAGVWAAGAAATGAIKHATRSSRNELARLGSVSAGVGVAAAGTFAVYSMIGMSLPMTPWLIATVSSLLLAWAFVAARERLFPVLIATPKRSVSMASEDADVDELLRLIATAEDKLASQHTSNRVVLITDMKSFSRMTEEDGSVATAKAIQRHRDLLLPVVSRNRGAGKSTGGDGLVAAFEDAGDALKAAAEMQVALAAHNAAHPAEREMWVRAGLASGEVVLDKGGRPFIGAALNLAARVMNLADGGQILTTADVASAARAADVSVHFFGQVELKNIARPVEIAEVLWNPTQEPHDPRLLLADGH